MSARPYRHPPPVEPEPERDEAVRLGSLQSVHAPPPLYRALFGPVMIAGVILLSSRAFSGWPFEIFAVVAALAFALLAWQPLRIRGWSAALHARGLVLVRPGARDVVEFDDVDEVWFETDRTRPGLYFHALRLVDFAGQARRVPLLVENGFALAGGVLRGCSDPLLLEARRALGEGRTLTFGQIRLDRAGITVGGARAAWGEIRIAVLSYGRVLLYRRLPVLAWRTVRLDRIPNAAVFTGLVAQHVEKAQLADPLLTPLAPGAPGASGAARPSAKPAASGAVDSDAALRNMLSGGIICIIGLLITFATYSANSRSYLLAYGPILFGAVRFIQGLAALLSGRGR